MRNLFNILRFARPYMRRYWRRQAAGVLLALLFAACNALFIGVVKTIVDRMTPPAAVVAPAAPPVGAATTSQLASLKTQALEVLDPWLPQVGRGLDWRQVLGGLLVLPLLMFLRGLSSYLSSYCFGWVSERMINDLRVDVLAKLNTLSLDYFNRSTMGDLLTRINGDTAALHRAMTNGFNDLVKEPFALLCLLIGLCLMDWRLTLVAVLFLSLIVIPMRIFGQKARRASHGAVAATVSQGSLLVEALTGIRVVKAFGLEDEQLQRFRSYARQLVHHGMKGVQARSMANPLIETAAMTGLGVLILWIVASGRTFANMAGFMTGLFLLFTPVKKIAALNILFYEASVGVDRLKQVFREQPSVKEPPQPKALSRFSTAIRFENVSFTYGNQLVVEHINLAIPRGFKLGIAGESGSGKSTLVNLLFRFYDPTAGRITIDGHDLRDLSLRDLRQNMALVSQEIVVFDKTVAENIACGKPGATRAEIEAAARHANAHEFIMALAEGYEARIGERGVTLSGGQRQRLSIARAFIRNAPILVLDEATAALDSQAEAEVQAAIDHLAENRTVISIAHRLSTLRTSDRIIVLSQGRIVEEGSFTDLIRKQAVFAAMAQRQGIVLPN